MQLEPSIHEALTQGRLLPDEPPTEAVHAWPTGTVDVTYARGCLLAGAVGDALGRPAETKRPSVIAERYGRIRDFMPWWGWESRPIGTFTDDTQLTLWTAESLLADDAAHQELFAATLAEHREAIRGIGFATDDTLVRLVDRIAELGPMLALEPPQAFAHTYNGAFDLESLSAAIWSFLHHPENLEEAICTAVAGGHDADTVAAICGNLAGAYLGEAAIPQRWLEELEDAHHIASLAEHLLALRP